MRSYAVISGTNAAPNPNYRTVAWATYDEDNLRHWANESFGTDIDAPLTEIAAAMQRGGWLLFKEVPTE